MSRADPPPVNLPPEELAQALWLRQDAASDLLLRSIRREESLRQAIGLMQLQLGEILQLIGLTAAELPPPAISLAASITQRSKAILHGLETGCWSEASPKPRGPGHG